MGAVEKQESPAIIVNDTMEGDVLGIEEAPVTAKMRKDFNIWSTIGFCYSISCAPLTIGILLVLSTGVGGSVSYIWGFLVSGLLNLTICISLCEIAAVYPHSSGQIFWTASLAPKKYARTFSYFSGATMVISWMVAGAPGAVLIAQSVLGVAQIIHGNFDIQPWMMFLLTVAIYTWSTFINVVLFSQFHRLMKVVMVVTNVVILYIAVGLLVRVNPKQDASFVFTNFTNNTGWDSDGWVFVLGLLPGIVTTSTFDSASHLSDEVRDPKRVVPLVMISVAVLGVVSGFPFAILYMFSLVHPENLLTPVGGTPFFQLLQDGFQNEAMTNSVIVMFTILLMCTGYAVNAGASRVYWSAAREGGVPFSRFASKINPTFKVPLNALLINYILTIALCALQLVSTVALNILTSGQASFAMLAYIIPIACMLFGGRSRMPADRTWNLGYFGVACNIIAVVWTPFAIISMSFPLYLPVDATNMNYFVVVASGLGLLFLGTWLFKAKKSYSFSLEDMQSRMPEGERPSVIESELK